MNAVAQVVVAVLLILVQVVLEVAEVLHLPVRLVLLVIRVRLEPLLEAVVQDQLIVVEVQKHRVVILQQVIVIPVLLPMVPIRNRFSIRRSLSLISMIIFPQTKPIIT